MDWKLFTYAAYTLISVALTLWVARSLRRNGTTFLVAVFDGDRELAGSVNHLLAVGFYLINLGFVSVALRTRESVPAATDAIELLSRKVGLVLLVVGVLHLGNLYVLGRIRRRRHAPLAPVQFGAYPGYPPAAPNQNQAWAVPNQPASGGAPVTRPTAPDLRAAGS
jgi:hypothetical protein